MPYDWSTALPEIPGARELPGVFSRHADDCPAQYGRRCTCGPLGYFATVVDPVSSTRIVSPQFQDVDQAVRWQHAQETGLIPPVSARDSTVAVSHEPSAVSYETPVTTAPRRPAGQGDLTAVIDEFLEAAQDGGTHDVDGRPYTRERLGELRSALSYADSELGTLKLQDIRRRNVQALIDQLRATGLEVSSVISIAEALRLVYSYAIQRGLVDHTPVVDIVLPEAGQTNGFGSPQGFLPPTSYPTPGGYPAPNGYPNGAGYPVPNGYPVPQNSHPTLNGTPVPGYAPPPNGYSFPTVYPPGASTSQALPAPGEKTLASRILGTPPSAGSGSIGDYDATQQERFLWWTVRIVVIVFVLIALVLVAESV